MKFRTFWPMVIVLIIVAGIAIAGYRMSRNIAPANEATSTPTATPAAGATGQATTSDSQDNPVRTFADTVPFPSATSTPGDGWKKYTSKGGGYSLQYPADLLSSLDGQSALTLIFPKNTYFHWPLLDDVTMKITSGLSCPSMLTDPAGQASTTFVMNGIDWTRTVGYGVGAGNRYQEVAFDTLSNGTCYHIGFLDHGTNGAGFYVDDQSLIKKYDAIHDADFAHVIDILNTVAASFRILAAPK